MAEVCFLLELLMAHGTGVNGNFLARALFVKHVKRCYYEDANIIRFYQDYDLQITNQ